VQKTGKISLQKFLRCYVQANLPVAFYRLPGEKEIKIVAQKKPELIEIEFDRKNSIEKGFLFAPFHESKGEKRILIQPDIFCSDIDLTETQLPSKIAIAELKNKTKSKGVKATSKKDFENLVRKIKTGIKQNSWSKIVAAGVIKQTKPKNFNETAFLKKLCIDYPNAFVSLVYTPPHGIWIGATPEVLLKVKDRTFTTYSLAGTKANKKKTWGVKEKEEQKLVSDYIATVISNTLNTKIEITGPATIKAGNIFHLRTTFCVRNVSHNRWPETVMALHPTPAVAGLPKKESIDFILKNEKTLRGFYCGYLGPVNLNHEINLYVNIRCMRVLKKILAVHVGCGITSNSKPAAEWQEAKNKSKTLLRVLKQ